MKPPTHRQPFDLAGAALPPGATLIEASAGTGKTFTLAGLFLRLILEEDLSVREILVVTFTEAATAELRGRIRQALADAARVFASGQAGDKEDFLRALLERHRAQAGEMRARLERALRGFDEAPIHTIHGFCQRTLKDRAFETGAWFDAELIADPRPLLEEVRDDFWRTRFYETDPALAAFALEAGLGPKGFDRLLELSQRHPRLRVVAASDSAPSTRLLAALDAARTLWKGQGSDIRALFGAGADWANKPYNREDEMAALFAQLDAAFGSVPSPEAMGALAAFTNEALRDGTHKKKAGQTPTHAFFDACDTVQARRDDWLSLLHAEFLAWVRDELPRRKERLKAQTFTDLLTRLETALSAPGGEALAVQLRARHRAALIDEFQDTDPVQESIFRRVFGGGGARLFFIGDPKQAIYGFRGADVFTYLGAAGRVERDFTLIHNRRSESALVRAVNTVFGQAEKPFVLPGIRFDPVEARGDADASPLVIQSHREPALQIWFQGRSEEKKSISKEKAEQELPDIVATEIVRLLNQASFEDGAPSPRPSPPLLAGERVHEGRVRGRSLRPRGIAVLVQERKQAPLVQAALAARGVPSVLHTDASVFDSAEAVELRRVLEAIARPGRERSLRSALVTELLGGTGTSLAALAADDPAWQARLESFQRLHHLWVTEGFMPMFRALLESEGARRRLLALPDGDRRLTNVLHLGELLHAASLERRLGPLPLTQWLAERIADESKSGDTQELRLERDDDAVQIVTIHKSKGLEYPVVFCPFLFRAAEVRRPGKKKPAPWELEVCFHDEAGDGAMVCDLGSPEFERNKRRAERERLAENVRLLYVALTRARHRCYAVWGAFNGAETSAPAWLWHPPAAIGDDPVESLRAHFTALDDPALLAGLRRLEEASRDAAGAPAIQVSDLPAASESAWQPPRDTPRELRPRQFTGRIRSDWRVSSFSALAAGRRDEAPDHDAAPPAPVLEQEEASGIFAFPRGTVAGGCLHTIFERVDFNDCPPEVLRRLVEETLREHDLNAREFAPAVFRMVEDTLRLTLDPSDPAFTLNRVPRAERLPELEFFFPTKPVSPAQLAVVFRRHGAHVPVRDWPEQLERLVFSPAGGFMTGFIDLVFRYAGRFYIVDWKSNWLGNRVEDYAPGALAAAMASHCYPLQYHLYALALHRHLTLTLPGYDYARHFGGVRYVFLRGVDPARPDLGVFRDCPDDRLMAALENLLIEAPRESAAGDSGVVEQVEGVNR
jgi:exodeoxyribonuclease V beta subunit